MPLVAGVDSSTQSVKVVIRDADSGDLIAQSSRPHPDGTEIHPHHWKRALDEALSEVNRHEIAAISIAGQQHGMIALNSNGEVIREALLWNDTRSDKAATDLNNEIENIHLLTGSKLVPSFTVTKVRWLVDNEPENANQVAAIALPHDWLSWKMTGSTRIEDIFTDRSDASGTGYFDSKSNQYQIGIFNRALRSERDVRLPRIITHNQFAAVTEFGIPIAAGAGDNAAAALGLGAGVGDLVISLGTSGTAFAVSPTSTHDESGEVAGFADATGNFLPLACTLNAAKVFATIADLIGVDFEELSRLALRAESGAGGLRLLPHFDGERTPNRPKVRGNLLGITHSNFTKENIARAAIEGVIGGMLFAAKAVSKQGIKTERILLIGGAARNQAVQEITAELFESEIQIPNPGEYVANGAARQAAWALSSQIAPPQWQDQGLKKVEPRSKSEVAASYLELIQSI